MDEEHRVRMKERLCSDEDRTFSPNADNKNNVRIYEISSDSNKYFRTEFINFFPT